MSIKKIALASGVAVSLMASTAYASVIDRPFFQVLGVVVVWGGTDFDENSGTAPVVSDFVLLTPATGTAGADLITGDVYSVVTGSLDPISDSGTAVDGTATFDPVTGETSGGTFTDNGTAGVLDAADTLTAFGLDATTDVSGGLVGSHNSSFYVASNAAFDIFAQSSNVVATGDFLTDGLDDENISFAMSIETSGTDGGLAFGGATAQDPSTGGTGVVATIDSLDDMSTQTKVFDGGQRTAAAPGSLTEQSVRFDSVYTLDSDTGTAGVQGYDLSMGVGTLQADVTYTIFVP
ncbi:hypothetical protein [Fretibacter rubidus]|uniref:hypothetical protein n=1 Tax=Fretibacter rubidus TaxID=570162 RepID=UPI00352B12E9